MSGSEYYSLGCIYTATGTFRTFLVRARQRGHAEENRMVSMFARVSHAHKMFREPHLLHKRVYVLSSDISKFQPPLSRGHCATYEFAGCFAVKLPAAKG